MALLDRLHAKLDTSGGPDACWPFRGAQSRGSRRETTYGSITEGPAGSKRWRVNRLVLLLEELPEEAFKQGEGVFLRWLHLADGQRDLEDAAHTCDYGPCGNPKHLQWESHRVNVQEQAARRREAKRLAREAA